MSKKMSKSDSKPKSESGPTSSGPTSSGPTSSGPTSTSTRAVPPDDISPLDFFSRWVPEMVARDSRRQKKLGSTQARIVFAFDEPGYGAYTIYVNNGEVRGEAGRVADPDLEIQIGIETWRSLNRGEISAPEAALRRRIKLTGDTVLALKLHVILG